MEEKKDIGYYLGMVIGFMMFAFAVFLFVGVLCMPGKVRWAQAEAIKERM